MKHFRSLREFQDAHRNLLQRYRAAGKVTPELHNDIEGLLRSGSETGRVLETLADQRAAQEAATRNHCLRSVARIHQHAGRVHPQEDGTHPQEAPHFTVVPILSAMPQLSTHEPEPQEIAAWRHDAAP